MIPNPFSIIDFLMFGKFQLFQNKIKNITKTYFPVTGV